jgi:hypothetical protein
MVFGSGKEAREERALVLGYDPVGEDGTGTSSVPPTPRRTITGAFAIVA